jgi:hypothetical protein
VGSDEPVDEAVEGHWFLIDPVNHDEVEELDHDEVEELD